MKKKKKKKGRLCFRSARRSLKQVCPIIKFVCLKKTGMNEVESRSHDDKGFQLGIRCICLRHSIIWTSTFPHGSAGKESACKMRDLELIPGLGRSFRERKGYPLQYSGLENSMDSIVHRVTKSWTGFSDFRFHSQSGSEQSLIISRCFSGNQR